MHPLTVVMAVYNDAGFLPTAIESILQQTYGDFHFLIVDDCSTDETPNVLAAYRDSRIEVMRLAKNVGQTAALNAGVRHAASPWIARMDADDYSAPGRFAHQMEALEKDPSLGCVGTGIWEFKEDPRVVDGVKFRPEAHEAIRRAALHGSGMIHGSIVVRREALLEIGGYDERYRYAADRDLFIRLLSRCRAKNLQQPLLGVRRTGDQDSFSLTAADEYIAIFSRLLAEPNGFSAEEIGIVRKSLAWSYLFRSRAYRQSHDFARWLQDQGRAWRTSPVCTIRNAANGASNRLLPVKLQQRLRRAFGGRERDTFRVR